MPRLGGLLVKRRFGYSFGIQIEEVQSVIFAELVLQGLTVTGIPWVLVVITFDDQNVGRNKRLQAEQAKQTEELQCTAKPAVKHAEDTNGQIHVLVIPKSTVFYSEPARVTGILWSLDG